MEELLISYLKRFNYPENRQFKNVRFTYEEVPLVIKNLSNCYTTWINSGRIGDADLCTKYVAQGLEEMISGLDRLEDGHTYWLEFAGYGGLYIKCKYNNQGVFYVNEEYKTDQPNLVKAVICKGTIVEIRLSNTWMYNSLISVIKDEDFSLDELSLCRDPATKRLGILDLLIANCSPEDFVQALINKYKSLVLTLFIGGVNYCILDNTHIKLCDFNLLDCVIIHIQKAMVAAVNSRAKSARK